MTAEQERIIRDFAACDTDGTGPFDVQRMLLAELDAERAAHEATKARLALAEAVCHAADGAIDEDTYDSVGRALAAWRETKGRAGS